MWSLCARYWARTLFLLLIAVPALAAEAEEGGVPWDLIPPEFFQEAIQVQADCAAQDFVAAHYDCQCLAVRFFDERIQQGPDADHDGIMMAVQDTCPNIPGRAGWAYTRCIGRPALAPPGWDGNPQGFCECYGNAYAKLFRGTPSARVSVAVETQAHTACSRPPP